jgi:hypothetical protein
MDEYKELFCGTRKDHRLVFFNDAYQFGYASFITHDTLFNTPFDKIVHPWIAENNYWKLRNVDFHVVVTQVSPIFRAWAQGRLYSVGEINALQYGVFQYFEFFLPSNYETILSCTQWERWSRHRPLRTMGFRTASGFISDDFDRVFIEEEYEWQKQIKK